MKTARLLAVAAGMALSAGVMAQTIDRTEFNDGKSRIGAEYQAATNACAALSDNARDICIAQAKGQQKVARAELEARRQPSSKKHYDVRIARADADYGVARKKCDDLSGNVKDVCVKEAKAARITAKADARAQLKSANANAVAVEARDDAAVKSRDARQEADAETVDAQFTVAREKCDVYAGAAKDVCLDKAMQRAGK